MKLNKKCNLCGKSSFKKVCIKNGWTLWECNNCSLVFVHPQPIDKELQEAYSYKSGYFEGVDFKEEELDPYFEKIFKNKKGNFLDIGCGTGRIVYTAKMCGWKAKGLDLNKDAVEIAKKKGLDIIHSNIDDFNGRKNFYDIINMGDLIEHVRNPEKTIRKAKTLLKKGGLLIISTPNINSFFPKYSFWISKIFQIPWSHPSPPYHLFEFSNKNFPQFLEKEGFKIEKITYSNISLMYSIGNMGIFNKFKNEFRKGRSLKKAFLKNNFTNNLLIIFISFIFLPSYIISKFLKVKDEMKIIVTKK
ncbi:MAG: class I SAM-dependent methyltransferase [Candidatus Pacearchaeota archaeon]